MLLTDQVTVKRIQNKTHQRSFVWLRPPCNILSNPIDEPLANLLLNYIVFMLLARRLFARQTNHLSMNMSRHLYLDSSPPPYTGPKDHLDREAFRKKLSVLGARVPPERTRVLLKANELKRCIYLLFQAFDFD